MAALKDLLADADFISLNPDLNPTSYHLIGTQQLDMMKHYGFGGYLRLCAVPGQHRLGIRRQ